jgi:signal transduction histidine kinase
LEKAMAVQMAAQAAADAKTRHIAFLCHEIRNPVNGILATVQAIEDLVDLDAWSEQEGSDGEAMCATIGNVGMHELVRTTLACTDQLRRTVDGVLDLSTMEEGKLEVETTSSSFKVFSVLRTVLNQVPPHTSHVPQSALIW